MRVLRAGRRAGRVSGAGGTATAELAVLLPALALLTVLCVGAVSAVALHVRCLDAARSGARALARDEPVPAVVAAAEARAPRGAVVRIRYLDGGLVAVEVTARAALAGPIAGGVPGVTVGGRAVAEAEGGAP